MGVTAGGMGLSITTESLAKVGVLLLNKGEYFGKRIISEEYIDLATSPRVTKQNGIEDISMKKYSGSQYGYQFHIGLDGSFRADGAFGQICFVAPKEKIIVAATSRGSKMETLLRLIHTHLLKGNQSDMRVNQQDYNDLQKKLSEMEYTVPKYKDIPSGVPVLNNSTYNVEENPNGIKKIILNQKGIELDCRIIYKEKKCNNLRFDFTKPIHDKDIFVKDIQTHEQKYISYASWENNSVLDLNLIYIETPYVVNYRLTFIEDTIRIDFHINVSLSLNNFTVCGKLDKQH